MKAAISSVLREQTGLDEKSLRKQVKKNLKASTDESALDFKTEFSQTIESLISKGKVISVDGCLQLAEGKTKKRKLKDDEIDSGESTKSKSAKTEGFQHAESKPLNKSVAAVHSGADDPLKSLWKTGEQLWRDNAFDHEYLRTNPDCITRLFCGNLKKDITEEQLRGCIEGITHIKWITDKQTKEFYGSTFLEMKDAKSAAEAVQKDRQKFMGRPLKLYYCPPRPGDIWPPLNTGGGRMGTGRPDRKRTPKAEGCRKLYAGNLSYNIDDDAMVDFLKDCGPLVGLRWLTHQGTDEFRGCGFVEFETTEHADAAILLDGKELLGRPIRLDWTD